MRFFLKGSLLALLLGLFPLACHADYFLHGEQMADLVTEGQITGEDGARYDIWVVPGYKGPGRAVVEGWSGAGRDLAEYGDGRLYGDIADTASSVLRFAGKDTIADFAFKGSATAWSEDLKTAQQRVDRRVFGWWFAYPWAVLEAGTESLFRVAVGVPGGVLIGAGGSTVLPAAQWLWPAGKSVYHALGEGTVFPVAAASWNTVVAPPLALLGQQPAPERADGFWMKRMDPQQHDAEFARLQKALEQWRRTLLAAPSVKAVEAEINQRDKFYEEERRRLLVDLNQRERAEMESLQQRRSEALRQQYETTALQSGIDREQLAGKVRLYGSEPLLKSLQGPGLTQQDADAALRQLVDEAGSQPVPPARRADGDKTDPLKRGLQRLSE
ncbi:MAG TPA: hypothetical protein VF050_09135 [Moraxellaceae bacterium]